MKKRHLARAFEGIPRQETVGNEFRDGNHSQRMQTAFGALDDLRVTKYASFMQLGSRDGGKRITLRLSGLEAQRLRRAAKICDSHPAEFVGDALLAAIVERLGAVELLSGRTKTTKLRSTPLLPYERHLPRAVRL